MVGVYTWAKGGSTAAVVWVEHMASSMGVLVKQEKTCWSMALQAASSSLALGAIEHTLITLFQMVTLGLELPWMSASS